MEWIGKFKAIGDTITQYDPAHAALPWAGIRVLLSVRLLYQLAFPSFDRRQVAQSDSEIFQHTANGIELVSSLVTRFAMIEGLYLD